MGGGVYNNVCRITWLCNMDFSKWRPKIFHEIEYLVIIILSFLENLLFSFEIHVFRSDQFSFLMYRWLLLSAATVKMDYVEDMNTLLCNEWWHSFMNQILNHLALLFKKCNRIRIMSLNTYNNNVDIIWHYFIVSQIKLHG
jgi:hypothetical protein